MPGGPLGEPTQQLRSVHILPSTRQQLLDLQGRGHPFEFGAQIVEKQQLDVHDRQQSVAGIEGRVSGHSLRVGGAQSLAAAGASIVEMQTAGRWQSPSMPYGVDAPLHRSPSSATVTCPQEWYHILC